MYADCAVTQHRAMRTFLGLGKCAPLPAMYGDLKWSSAFVRHQASAVRYWARLIKMPHSRLTRRIFDWDYAISISGRRCWNKDIKDIFNNCNLQHLFAPDSWSSYSVSGIYDAVSKALLYKHRQQLIASSETMSRLRVYNALDATRTETDSYIGLSRGLRTAIAKLRSGTLPLAIETGRYTNTPPERRICRMCNDDEIENELHFLFICDRFTDIRLQHLGNILNDNVNIPYIDTLSIILSNISTTKSLAKYIIDSMRRRRSLR